MNKIKIFFCVLDEFLWRFMGHTSLYFVSRKIATPNLLLQVFGLRNCLISNTDWILVQSRIKVQHVFPDFVWRPGGSTKKFIDLGYFVSMWWQTDKNQEILKQSCKDLFIWTAICLIIGSNNKFIFCTEVNGAFAIPCATRLRKIGTG